MLALPKAVSLAGLWVGSIGIAILSVFCIQCMHLIVQSSQKLCSVTGRSSMSYADVAEFTFSTSSNKSIHRYAKIFRYFIYKYLEHVFKYKNDEIQNKLIISLLPILQKHDQCILVLYPIGILLRVFRFHSAKCIRGNNDFMFILYPNRVM